MPVKILLPEVARSDAEAIYFVRLPKLAIICAATPGDAREQSLRMEEVQAFFNSSVPSSALRCDGCPLVKLCGRHARIASV